MSPSMMASTRRPPTVEVFEDQDASFSSNGNQDVEAALFNALGPLSDASNKHNVQLIPTTGAARGSSPRKIDSSPPRPISSRGLTDVKIPPPAQSAFTTDSPQKDSNFYSAYQPPTQQPPETALFAQFSSIEAYDQENFYDTTAFHSLPALPYGELSYDYKGHMKRSFPESAPLRDRSHKKLKMEREEPFELPNPKDMPSVHDDGTKPSHSYAELIGMAILRAPRRRLTLAQIYKWISDNFSFYKAAESGWQNSIRHNLSLNKNFIKQERPKDDPGKGNYWAIKPGEERPFLLGKKTPIRRITNPDGSSYINGLPSEMGYQSSTAPAIGHFTLAPNPVKKGTKAIDSAKFPTETDFSSDGTIPASDPALQDDERDDSGTMMPPPTHMRSSPPPADLGSSPPPMVTQQRKATPPPVPRFPSTSRSGSRRQKFAGLNDSGYWSSIESSAARGAAYQLTSEADMVRPRIRKGRAEEEIARIRSSSVDSPSKEINQIKAPASHFESSSPGRDDNPLTPAVVFKRPAKPPPSISPNTNLRNHRNRMRALLGTPAKMFSPAPEFGNSWSPAFNLGEDGSVGLTPYLSPDKPKKTPWKPFQDAPDTPNNSFNTAFDIFIDAPEEDMTARGSPEKRSARRSSLARAATSTSILADITGSARSNNHTLAPPTDSPFSLSPFFTKSDSLRSPARLGSPLKQSHMAPTSNPSSVVRWHDVGTGEENMQPTHKTSKNDAADFFGVNLGSDGSEEGIDIFQDFGKIGQTAPSMPTANRANGSPVKRSMAPPARPSLARSITSRW